MAVDHPAHECLTPSDTVVPPPFSAVSSRVPRTSSPVRGLVTPVYYGHRALVTSAADLRHHPRRGKEDLPRACELQPTRINAPASSHDPFEPPLSRGGRPRPPRGLP